MKELSILELINRYKITEDLSYISELYYRYRDKVYSICRAFLENKEDAEDAVQDIFEKKFIHYLKSYDVPQNEKSANKALSTWIYKCTKNHCCDELRRRKTKLKKLKYVDFQDRESLERLEQKLSVEIDESERSNFIDKNIGNFKQAWEKLPFPERKCIELHKLEGLKITDKSLDDLKLELPIEILDKLNTIKDQEIRGKIFFFELVKTAIGNLESDKYFFLILKYASRNTTKSYPEIAKITGYTYNDIKNHIRNAKKHLKKLLNRRD